MIIPELPSYLSSMGGGKYIGLIIGLFTLAALISRPYSGRLTDTLGRIPVMVIGAAVCFILGFLYVALPFVLGFLVLRFFHGFSTGFKPTATSAYVADITPPHRKGEAVGYLSISGSLGMTSGPAIGSFLTTTFGYNSMFYTSSAVALLSVGVLIGMRETLENKQKFSWKLLKLKKADFFEKRVIHACIVVLGILFPYGVILTIIPDAHATFGLQNKGWYLVALTLSSLISRIIGGRLSDLYGRVPILIVSGCISVSAMIVTATASTAFTFLLGGGILGLSSGLNNPAITAWILDLALKEYIGRAMASMYMALELSIGLGAVLSGTALASWGWSFREVMLTCSIMPAFALLYLIQLAVRKHPSVR